MSVSLQGMLLSTVWAGLCVTGALAETRYVAQAGQTPSSDYTSWASAASNIQDAVDAAVAGDTILVSNGVYDVGGVVADGQTNRVYINNKKLTLQAVSANPADTIIVGGGTLGPDAVRCVFMDGVKASDSIISGFMLTNGYARNDGGGLSTGLRLTVTNCWVVGCVAMTSGGGIAGLNVRVEDSLMLGNRAGYAGGGLLRGTVVCSTIAGNTAPKGGGAYLTHASYDSVYSNNVASDGRGGGIKGNKILVSHCVISSNSATHNGGGVWGVILTNGCVVANNVSEGYGGGAVDAFAFDTLFSNNIAKEGGGLSKSGDWSRAYSTNCLFINNRSLTYGGGQRNGTSIDCVFSNNLSMARGGGGYYLVATNCSFVGNISTNDVGYGGGLYYGSAVNSRFIGNVANLGGGAFRTDLVNCLVVNNHALDTSSAIHGGAVLLNCTVVGNTGAESSTRGSAFSTSVQATNCIVWANVQLSDGATNNWLTNNSSYRFANCCISPLPTGGQDSGGNMDVNPRFVDADGGDYRLRASSPCVNAGMNLDWMVGAVDLDGRPRVFPADGIVDMGAFERIPGNTTTILLIR